MKRRKNTKLKAFTLAEILITLSIIGVVAALTIPTLIQRTGDEEIVSKLNKAYSTLSQATEMIITEQGGVKTWAADTDAVYEAYRTHLRNSKECGSKSGCFSQLETGGYKTLNGGVHADYNSNGTYKTLILSDGMQLVFDSIINTQCKKSDYGSNNYCIWMAVDVNGIKKPNVWGRDTFGFVLKENGLYPWGCDDETKASCSKEGAGYGCACKVLQEGKIDY